MNPLKGACIIGQSGGPTAVINASALGAIQAALQSEQVTRVLGAANGIEGVLKERLFDMAREDPEELELLKYTPASALGSCRYKMAAPSADDTDYRRLLEIFRKYNVRYFFYNGGNDSMDTCNKISKFMQQSGYECRVIGIPKTIDNDLHGTDHCPGFGSAAKFIATSCMEVHQDLRVYDKGRVTIVEIMGRHAGWLAGSAALATYAGAGPDLVYLPEVPFRMEEFWQDVDRIYRQNGSCMVAVSEGVQYADGRFVAESGDRDVFGHTQLGGLGAMLAESVKRQTGAKVRSIELSLLQRCASHVASKTDIDEAYMAGKAAVDARASRTALRIPSTISSVVNASPPKNFSISSSSVSAMASLMASIRPWKRWPMSGRSTCTCLPPSYLKAFWLNRLMYTGVPSSSLAGTTQGQTVAPNLIFMSSRILK